jgi:hypothetical protein
LAGFSVYQPSLNAVSAVSADGPLVGLSGAHRPAGHERERLDPERGHEFVLLLDLVVERHVREARGVVRRRRVGWRAGEPVTQHVRDDDEELARVQGHAVSDQPLVVPVAPRVPGRVHDRVALVGVQLAVGLVRELGVPQRRAVLQRHIAEIEDLVVLRELIHRNGTSSLERTCCRFIGVSGTWWIIGNSCIRNTLMRLMITNMDGFYW